MSELDEAIADLERAVARLEAAAPSPAEGRAGQSGVQQIAAALALRVDAALARIGRLLGEDG